MSRRRELSAVLCTEQVLGFAHIGLQVYAFQMYKWSTWGLAVPLSLAQPKKFCDRSLISNEIWVCWSYWCYRCLKCLRGLPGGLWTCEVLLHMGKPLALLMARFVCIGPCANSELSYLMLLKWSSQQELYDKFNSDQKGSFMRDSILNMQRCFTKLNLAVPLKVRLRLKYFLPNNPKLPNRGFSTLDYHTNHYICSKLHMMDLLALVIFFLWPSFLSRSSTLFVRGFIDVVTILSYRLCKQFPSLEVRRA